MPKQSHTFCHCESVTDVTGVAIRNIPYPTPPFPSPRAALFAARPGSREHERNDK